MLKKSKKDNSSDEMHIEDHEIKHEKLEEKLIENLIELQKVHTDLAEKFNNLSNNISSLLKLFEMTARSFAQYPANQVSEKDREFLEKIDKLLEQNKTIAKGLTLVEERIRDRVYSGQQPRPQNSSIQKKDDEEYTPSSINRPLPKF